MSDRELPHKAVVPSETTSIETEVDHLTCKTLVIIAMFLFELHIQIFRYFDILEHAGQLVHVVCRHTDLLS